MEKLVQVLSEDEIREKVSAMAERISADFAGTGLVCVGVLKGAFVFLADLARKLSLECTLDFVRVASYGSGTQTSGNLLLTKDLESDVAGRPVLIVEDIVDTGLTTDFLKRHLLSLGARSVHVCAMVDKTGDRRVDLETDYACHRVTSGFLVGYGMDRGEKFRCLPGIYALKP